MASSIRSARPDDAPFLAEIMLLAARSHLPRSPWDLVLNASDPVCLAYLERMSLAEEGCPTHYSHFVIAEVDGEAAAAVAGYDPPRVSAKRFGERAMRRAGLPLGRSLADVFAKLDRCAWPEELEPRAWIIESMATLPRFRRRGLMTTLLERILEVGRRERDCLFARVHVFIGNTAAEGVYTRAGFVHAGEKRDQGFEVLLGCPGMKLLKRPL